MMVGSNQITSRPPPFVQILQEQGKLTPELVAEALHIQTKERTYLGQTLCEIGRLNPADIDAALTVQESRAFSIVASSLAGRRHPLAPAASTDAKELAPMPVRPSARASLRSDLSAPFTVILMAGLASTALFLSEVVQQGVPLGRILPLAIADPFGVIALALLAAAGVMARIGEI
jgi:hypothetical protein